MIQYSEESKLFLSTRESVLCLGGPGSGKTTMALLKVEREINEGSLRDGQKILFLSFARATITRVQEHSTDLISKNNLSRLEINTYHGFIWSLLKSHGYLITKAKTLELVPPHIASAMLSGLEEHEEKVESERMFIDEGLLTFGLFAKFAGELLSRSRRLRELVSRMYPIIILDEFQDTDAEEWKLICQLQGSRLIALADPDQRIYEFRGASPERIGQFLKACNGISIDFGENNFRSPGTDICAYGKDILSGKNIGKQYKDVIIEKVTPRDNEWKHIQCKVAVWKRRNYLIEKNPDDWSLAILVPTTKLMIEISDFLANTQTTATGKVCPKITNEVMIDSTGPTLSAAVIATVMDKSVKVEDRTLNLFRALCDHIRATGGGKNLSGNKLADALIGYTNDGKIRGKNRVAIKDDIESIIEKSQQIQMSGEPGNDWLELRKLFDKSTTSQVKKIASEVVSRIFRTLC